MKIFLIFVELSHFSPPPPPPPPPPPHFSSSSHSPPLFLLLWQDTYSPLNKKGNCRMRAHDYFKSTGIHRYYDYI